jgi:hypothetical protein
MILNHRIVALDAGKPHNVECLTCRSTHRFRPNAPGTKAPSASSGGSSRSAAEPRAPRATTVTRAEQARLDHEKGWEKAIAGRALSDFKPYSIGGSFNEGDLIKHSKYGEGVVQRVLEPKKIEVAFRDETRTLAQNLVD